MDKNFILVLLLFLSNATCIFGQAYQQNNQTVIQQNQQNVNINVPVIEKKVYIDRYRTVYVDRPQPKRVAKKLAAPICLYGYLWVYTEDIGNFKTQSDALEVIRNINAQAPFGRDTWRIPSSAELSVLEQNAEKIGLGEDIYLAEDHRNGVLRMVSTGPTVAERKAEAAKLAIQQRQQQEEAQRIADQQRREREQAIAAEKRRKEAEEAEKLARIKEKQWEIANPKEAVWKRCGLDIKYHPSISWRSARNCYEGYRLATSEELRKIHLAFQDNQEVLQKLVKYNNPYGDRRNGILTYDSKTVKSYYDGKDKYRAGKNKYRWVVEISNVVKLASFNIYNTPFIQETTLWDDWYESEGSARSNGNYYFNLSSFAAIYVKQ